MKQKLNIEKFLKDRGVEDVELWIEKSGPFERTIKLSNLIKLYIKHYNSINNDIRRS
jgi:hypothetical protein